MATARAADLEQAWVLLSGGEPAAARAVYESILRSEPLNHEAVFLLGIAHAELGNLPAALDQFTAITQLDPSHADGWFQRGVVALALARLEEATASLRRFMQERPDDTAGRFQYGYALACLGQYADAAPILARVLDAEPDNELARVVHAQSLVWTGEIAKAKDCFRRLTELAPNCVAGWYGMGLLHLTLGEYAAGWPLFEWGAVLKGDPPPPRGDECPRWDGRSDIRGKTLLLYADAGLGDTIQFSRFAPLVAAAGARVILRVPRSLVRLMRSVTGVDNVVANGAPLPPFDLSCPIMSLPFVLGITLDTLPDQVPYLWPTSPSVAAWHTRLASLRGLRVGLTWAAAPRPGGAIHFQNFSQRKSMALTTLAPLATVPGVSFVMLQIGEAGGQIRQSPLGITVNDFTELITDFEDTAGLIANLDLVISVDTSVAHLSGAMGRPVWLMNLFDTDWRWLLEREDSPWYPSLRVFRQPDPGNWGAVVSAVTAALRNLATVSLQPDSGFNPDPV
jgi:tetratricopeptide (TPR) repeat protein